MHFEVRFSPNQPLPPGYKVYGEVDGLYSWERQSPFACGGETWDRFRCRREAWAHYRKTLYEK